MPIWRLAVPEMPRQPVRLTASTRDFGEATEAVKRLIREGVDMERVEAIGHLIVSIARIERAYERRNITGEHRER